MCYVDAQRGSERRGGPGAMGLTIEALACARGIEPARLLAVGWREEAGGIAVPWQLEHGGTATHLRRRLDKDGPGPRWTWTGFVRQLILPYGAERLSVMRQRDTTSIIVTESEADAVGLWAMGMPAIATAGADMWRGRWWPLLHGFGKLIVWIEDTGSVGLAEAVLRTRPEATDLPDVFVCFSADRTAKDVGRIRAARNGTAS